MLGLFPVYSVWIGENIFSLHTTYKTNFQKKSFQNKFQSPTPPSKNSCKHVQLAQTGVEHFPPHRNFATLISVSMLMRHTHAQKVTLTTIRGRKSFSFLAKRINEDNGRQFQVKSRICYLYKNVCFSFCWILQNPISKNKKISKN